MFRIGPLVSALAGDAAVRLAAVTTASNRAIGNRFTAIPLVKEDGTSNRRTRSFAFCIACLTSGSFPFGLPARRLGRMPLQRADEPAHLCGIGKPVFTNPTARPVRYQMQEMRRRACDPRHTGLAIEPLAALIGQARVVDLRPRTNKKGGPGFSGAAEQAKVWKDRYHDTSGVWGATRNGVRSASFQQWTRRLAEAERSRHRPIGATGRGFPPGDDPQRSTLVVSPAHESLVLTCPVRPHPQAIPR